MATLTVFWQDFLQHCATKGTSYLMHFLGGMANFPGFLWLYNLELKHSWKEFEGDLLFSQDWAHVVVSFGFTLDSDWSESTTLDAVLTNPQVRFCCSDIVIPTTDEALTIFLTLLGELDSLSEVADFSKGEMAEHAQAIENKIKTFRKLFA